MNRLPPRRAVWLPGVIAFLVLPPSAFAQPRVPFEQDNHAFRYVLWQLGLRALSQPDDIWADPFHTMVIIFGQTRVPGLPPSQLQGFVHGWGALLIATDQPTDEALEVRLGFRVNGSMVRVMDKSHQYRGSPDCPVVIAPSAAEPPQSIFNTDKPIATNKPSYLDHLGSQPGLKVLASFPPDLGARGVMRLPRRFAWGGNLGNGHLLALSDHSVFINGMMLQTDNGNFDFAYNCVKWLSDSGKRRNVLFVDEGAIVKDFSVPLTNLPVPPISPLEAADHVIPALEQDDVFNRLILEQFSLRRIMSAGAVALTAMLLVVVFYRLMRAGYHVETQVPLVAQAAGRAGSAAAVMEQRRQALLQAGNLWEAARDVARQWFADLGYQPAPASERARPSIRINAGWWRRRQLRGQVSRLWRLAFQPQPRRVSRRDFDRLLSEVRDLRAAAQEGVVQLQQPGTTA